MGWLQLSAKRIDAGGDERIAVLVRGDQATTGRIDAEAARRLSLRRLVRNVAEPSGSRIDPVDHDAIVAAVRGVDEIAERMHVDVCARALARERLGKGANGLQMTDGPCATVAGENDHRRVKLVYQIRKVSARMEREMARTGSRLHLDPGHRVRVQLATLWIEAVDHQLVESKVRYECEAVRRIERNRVSVRAALPTQIDTRSLVLNEVASFFERSVVTNRLHAYATAHESDDEDILSLLVDDDMAGVGAVSELPVL